MKRHASLLLVLGFFAFSIGANATSDETFVDKFKLDLSGAWGGWHLQTANIGGNSALVNGGFGGLEFNKTIFVGWTAYKVSDNFASDGDTREYSLSYNGPMIAYTPRARSVIHPKFAMQVGFGNYDVEDRALDKFLVLQPSVGGEINVLRWFRLGGQAGYRYSLNSDYASDDPANIDGFFLEGTLKFGFSWGAN